MSARKIRQGLTATGRESIGLTLLLLLAGAAQADPPQVDALEHWELDFDSGVLDSVGARASSLDYTFLPQIVTIKSGAALRRELGSGTLILRHRVSLLIEPIIRGPETHFIGVAAAPSIEWWNAARSFSTFFSIGGGFGWMDSQGYSVAGGQGQDFNLNWFIHGGVRWQLTDRMSAAVGLYFQHISNGNMDRVNPGVDTLGPTIGIGWRL